MKNSFILFLLLCVACSKPNTNKKTYWVNSYKQECMGVSPRLCLLVQKGDTIKPNNWEFFYSNIQGFNYEEGYIYELYVQEKEIENPAADASSIAYTLIEELSKTLDPTINLHDIWVLKKVSDDMFIAPPDAPTLEINLAKQAIMGSDGCNNYNGSIFLLTNDKITFGPIASTKKMCMDMTVPDLYMSTLQNVVSYELNGLNLIFKNESGEPILTFQKVD